MGAYAVEVLMDGHWRLMINSSTGIPFIFSSIKEAQEEIEKHYPGEFKRGGQFRIKEI